MAEQNAPAPGGNQPSKITPEALQAAIAVLTAAAQQPQAPTVDEKVAKEKQTAVELASKVEAIDAEIKALSEKKKAACVSLLPLIHAHFGGRITLANGTDVFAKIDAQKRPTKKGIVAFFTLKLKDEGAKLAAEFWKGLKGKPREYISVSRAGEPQPPVDADGDPVEPPTEE